MCYGPWRFGATAAACVLFAVPALAYVADGNLLQNGDFEDLDGREGMRNGHQLDALHQASSWDVYYDLPGGWTTVDGMGVEVQTSGTLSTIGAYSGAHYIELDSAPRFGATNSTIEQSLTLDPGDYEFSFYYSPRGQDVRTNGIEYYIVSDILVNEVTGPSATSGTSVGSWTRISHLFKITETQSVTVGFSATGWEDALGGFIDGVRISAIPLPAAGWLLLAAAGGLVAAGRARRAG